MVETSYWSGPGRSGGDEPGLEATGGRTHNWRAINTRLSSGTTAEIFACPVGPWRNLKGEAGTKKIADMIFVSAHKKGWIINIHVSTKDLVYFVFERFRSTLNINGPLSVTWTTLSQVPRPDTRTWHVTEVRLHNCGNLVPGSIWFVWWKPSENFQNWARKKVAVTVGRQHRSSRNLCDFKACRLRHPINTKWALYTNESWHTQMRLWQGIWQTLVLGGSSRDGRIISNDHLLKYVIITLEFSTIWLMFVEYDSNINSVQVQYDRRLW